jgi:hypothetical protein
MRILAVINEPQEVRWILRHLVKIGRFYTRSAQRRHPRV